MADTRLIELLERAVDLMKQEWTVLALIESYITNNNGLKDAQVTAAIAAIARLAQEDTPISEESCNWFMAQVAKSTAIVTTRRAPITPLSFDDFSIKYVEERDKAGDTTKPEDLTTAYAVYCRDPAGHWLHKE